MPEGELNNLDKKPVLPEEDQEQSFGSPEKKLNNPQEKILNDLNKRPLSPQEEISEKQELLKRGEVRTMERDLSKLREEEAANERERLASLKPEDKSPELREDIKPKTAAPVQKEPEEAPGILIPKKFKKPSTIQKILVRVIAVVLVFLTIGFFYWLLTEKLPGQKAVPETKPPAEEEEIIIPPFEEEEIITEEPEITVSDSLILTDATKTVEIASLGDLPQSLNEALQEITEPGTTRIVVKNNSEARLIGLAEFFEGFEIMIPGELLPIVSNDFTLFDLFSGNGHRLALVATSSDPESAYNTIRNWEETMEQDLKPITALLTDYESPYSSSFRTTYYGEVYFRYQTLTRQDLGLCYTLYNNNLILTTSFEGLKEAVNQLAGYNE